MNGRPIVFVPCPGQPACPDHLFKVAGHRHFSRASVRVRRVVPGCWEVWCPCCVPAPAVAQVSTWGRAMQRASEHVRKEHQVTLAASDPQPPPGSVVRDDCCQRWVNSGCYPSAWMPVDGDGDSESWTKVAGNYGPVTVIEWGSDDEVV